MHVHGATVLTIFMLVPYALYTGLPRGIPFGPTSEELIE